MNALRELTPAEKSAIKKYAAECGQLAYDAAYERVGDDLAHGAASSAIALATVNAIDLVRKFDKLPGI